jgi:ribosomal protein L16 Arg81 hydroxylase
MTASVSPVRQQDDYQEKQRWLLVDKSNQLIRNTEQLLR